MDLCGSQEEQELLKKYHYWQTEQCALHQFLHPLLCTHASREELSTACIAEHRPGALNINVACKENSNFCCLRRCTL